MRIQKRLFKAEIFITLTENFFLIINLKCRNAPNQKSVPAIFFPAISIISGGSSTWITPIFPQARLQSKPFNRSFSKRTCIRNAHYLCAFQAHTHACTKNLINKKSKHYQLKSVNVTSNFIVRRANDKRNQYRYNKS